MGTFFRAREKGEKTDRHSNMKRYFALNVRGSILIVNWKWRELIIQCMEIIVFSHHKNWSHSTDWHEKAAWILDGIHTSSLNTATTVNAKIS